MNCLPGAGGTLGWATTPSPVLPLANPADPLPSSQSMEKMVTRLDKDNLRPVQKESYLCMARCCDTAAGPAELQQW